MPTDKQIREHYQGDFIPHAGLAVDVRQVNALEYIAHQMGLIRKELEVLNETLKRQGG